MPAPKVTESSPVHIVFILDNSSSMGSTGANEELKKSLAVTLDEFKSWTGESKKYFYITLITFATGTEVVYEHVLSNELGDDSFTALNGKGGTTNVVPALNEAYKILERDGADEDHYKPLIIVLSDGGFHDERSDIEASAKKLKEMNHPAGTPMIICLALGTNKEEVVLKEMSSEGRAYARINSKEDLISIMPTIGTVTQAGGDDEIIDTIEAVNEENMTVHNFGDDV
jgi:uncharacterized protein YegL